MRLPGFVGPGYTLEALAADCQRCVGWFPEINELKTQADGEPGALVQVPGLRLLASLGAGPIRGVYYTSSNRLAVVSGAQVYRVNPDWSYAVAGELTTREGPVYMADNGSQLLIVDGPCGYIVSLVDGSLTRIEADGFNGASSAVFQDGYFIISTPGTNQFGLSALYNGFSWDALDFGAAEGSPDIIVAIVSNQRQVWIFGQKTIEVWWNTGNADFPFARIDGMFIEFGCAAPATALKFNNTVVWLGGGANAGGVVWSADGAIPTRISNHAVETAMQKYGDLSTATAYTYQQNGHSFYALNFPNAKTTWVYDASTMQWSERCYLNAGVEERHRAENYVRAYDTHIVGDYQNGNIYALDTNVFTDNGNPLLRIRRGPHISANMQRVFYSAFQLDMAMGEGLDGSPVVGKNPVVSLRWSDDFGHTWSPYMDQPIGPLGAYQTRILWRKLGQSRNRVFEIRITDPIRATILGAEITVQGQK